MPRWLALAAAVLATAAGLVGALYLGGWAFDVRRFSTHEGRLSRLLAHEPRREQVEQAFREEGTRLLASAEDAPALRALARGLAGARAGEVEAAGGRYACTQAFAAGDMLYFVHFDERRVMRAFTLVSRSRRGAVSP